MSVVIDNSMALAWALPDEGNALSDAVLDQVVRLGGYVPFIFRAEFANGLTMAARRQRIDPGERSVALAFLENLQLVHDSEGATRLRQAIELADRHELTVYDALYLELAQRTRLPLATLDKKLAAAARRAGVALAPQT